MKGQKKSVAKSNIEKIIEENQRGKTRSSNNVLGKSKSNQQLVHDKIKGPSMNSLHKPLDRKVQKSGLSKNLQISIPEDKQSPARSNSQNLTPGEENLAPSTEKKIDKGRKNVPCKTSGIKTGTHLG